MFSSFIPHPSSFRLVVIVSDPICEQCGQEPAVVFITQMLGDQTSKTRLCEDCARQKAHGEGWFSQLIEQWSDESGLSDEVREALEEIPLEQVMLDLFETDFDDALKAPGEFEMSDPFDDAAELSEMGDAFDDDFESNDSPGDLSNEENEVFGGNFAALPLSHASGRCSHCNTTWDKIKRDGRAGCAACYDTFRAELGEVMERVQRAQSHIGKLPRAAQKRRRRLDHLRVRHQHQLELLQNRLKTAVAGEKYEEAAKLRDKIKTLSAADVLD